MAQRIREPRDDDRPTARAFWSGTITFGLVSIPVDLLAASRGRASSLRMLGGSEGEPLRRIYVCPDEDEPLERDEIARGYELDDGEFVVVTDEELEGIAPEKTRDIDLQRFVDAASIDPLLFERGYFLAPSGSSSKAYRLLAETMERTGRAGVATFVMRGKEYAIAIFAEGGLLRAETLRFADELRTPEDIGLPEREEAPPERVRKMAKAIESLAADEIDPSELVDERTARLRELVARKQKRGEDVVELEGAEEAPAAEGDGEPEAEVIDLMQVLKERLGVVEAGRPGPRKARAKKTRAKKSSRARRRSA